MLFTADSHAGIAAGTITRTFRVWTRPQAKVGGRYRTGGMVLEADDVRSVPLAEVTDADARGAGFADRVALVAFLGKRNPSLSDTTEVWRVDFHPVVDDAPPLSAMATLTDADVAMLRAKLDGFEQRSPTGPWAHRTLALIAERPGTVSTDLAPLVGQDRPTFKTNVRKLKALGLTTSLEVGYELSPRGRALLTCLSS